MNMIKAKFYEISNQFISVLKRILVKRIKCKDKLGDKIQDFLIDKLFDDELY